jgi:peroxiredoxin
MTKFTAGDTIRHHDLLTIHGKTVRIPDPDLLVHLQFRRYAGCPVCNLHMRSIAARHDEIVAAGIREVVVFHSDPETMLPFQGALPFAVVADPDRTLYAEFGVGTMPLTNALRLRSWRAAARSLAAAPTLRGIGPKGQTALGLPADFLITPAATILAARYGKFTDDHWSVDELLALGASHPGSLLPADEDQPRSHLPL